jgi:hypothetical protein
VEALEHGPCGCVECALEQTGRLKDARRPTSDHVGREKDLDVDNARDQWVLDPTPVADLDDATEHRGGSVQYPFFAELRRDNLERQPGEDAFDFTTTRKKSRSLYQAVLRLELYIASHAVCLSLTSCAQTICNRLKTESQYSEFSIPNTKDMMRT